MLPSKLEAALKQYYDLSVSEMDPREFVPTQREYLKQMANILKDDPSNFRWIYDMLKRSDLVTEEVEVECFAHMFSNGDTK